MLKVTLLLFLLTSISSQLAANCKVINSDTMERDLYLQARASKNYVESVKLYDRLVEIDKANIGERADFYAHSGKTTLARLDYMKAVETNPTLWLPARIRFYISQGEYRNAITDCDDLLSRRKSAVSGESGKDLLADAYWLRSRAHEMAKQRALALEDMKTAAQLSLSKLVLYSKFCKKEGLTENYLETLNLLCLQLPEKFLGERAKFYCNKGATHLAQRDYDQLVEISRKYAAKDGYSPLAWAYFSRGNFFLEQGKTSEATEDFHKAKIFEKRQKILFGFSGYPHF